MMEGDLFTSQQLNKVCFRRSLKHKTRYKRFSPKRKGVIQLSIDHLQPIPKISLVEMFI